jgi:hypothetical protein
MMMCAVNRSPEERVVDGNVAHPYSIIDHNTALVVSFSSQQSRFNSATESILTYPSMTLFHAPPITSKNGI